MRQWVWLAAAWALWLTASCGDGAEVEPQGSENNLFDGEGGGRWESRAAMEVGGRQEVSVVGLEGKMYVIGGFNEAVQVVPSMEVYDPAADAWSSAASLPVRLHHANAAVVQGRIYVVGFLSDRGFTPDGQVFVYDPAMDAWESRAPMPAGTERGASAVGVVDGKIIVAGGLRGGAVADTSIYDPATDTWEARAPMLAGVDHATGQAVDGALYVFGGRFRSINSHVARVQRYDPVTDTWEERAPMPTSRAGLASAVLDGRVYVMGGEGNPGHVSGVFSDNEVYDPATDSWEVVRPMLTRRHGTGALALEGGIHVPGGAAFEAFAAIPIHEVYFP